MRKISNVTAAYVAGLVDRSGNIYFGFGHQIDPRKRESGVTYISISSSCKPVLTYLESVIGGNTYPNPSKAPPFRMHWFWRLGSQDTFILLSRMARYLRCPIYIEKAYLLLKNKALITKMGPRTESEKKRLRRLSEKMRALRKGTMMWQSQ